MMGWIVGWMYTRDPLLTVGSATTICTDKTGTLTANRMTVRAVAVAGKIILPASEPTGVKLRKQIDHDVSELIGMLIAVDTMDESYLLPNKAVSNPPSVCPHRRARLLPLVASPPEPIACS